MGDDKEIEKFGFAVGKRGQPTNVGATPPLTLTVATVNL
jgi:hypothetical protein